MNNIFKYITGELRNKAMNELSHPTIHQEKQHKALSTVPYSKTLLLKKHILDQILR